MEQLAIKTKENSWIKFKGDTEKKCHKIVKLEKTIINRKKSNKQYSFQDLKVLRLNFQENES